jgi:hypothetical protein
MPEAKNSRQRTIDAVTTLGFETKLWAADALSITSTQSTTSTSPLAKQAANSTGPRAQRTD